MLNHDDKILQTVIEDLLITNNQVLYLGQANPPLNWLAYQVHSRVTDAIGNISKLIEEDASTLKDFSLFNHMTQAELQELSKIENIRSNLITAWKFVEKQKIELLRAVKERSCQLPMTKVVSFLR